MARVAAVILAAGEGRRAGGPKAFQRWQDPVSGREESFLSRVAGVALAGGADPVVAVLRPQDLERGRAEDPPGLRRVVNPEPGRGMLSSLGCGLDALPSEVHAVLAFPVDHPDVLPGTVAALIEACSMEGGGLWAPVYEGRSGHPVAVSISVFQGLPREDLPGGLAAWVRARGLQWLPVQVDDSGILRNRNTGDGLPAPSSGMP